MAKGNNQQGNREAKKPKKGKEKVLATAVSSIKKTTIGKGKG